ncbi:hypothetical protein THAR02_03602 [Trichoderma harzianum]|uniref:Uncharacterized protein n=1 Tax=Trichoderma harzianum TaxID=5544 RepID=A0A0F9XII2_TRIHA|nr:hypothetical protein THAR02_03602 [Trichoderma harzianum]
MEDPKTRARLLFTTDDNDPSFKDEYGRTPLLRAAEEGHEWTVKSLLAKNNADLNFKDGTGRTPLSWAAGRGHKRTVELLLTKDGIEPDTHDKHGWSPLSWAVIYGHKQIVELLLAKKGVEPDGMDKYGQTPLSWAVRNRHKQIVELLLATDGVDPDVEDEDGRTPLSWATDEGTVKLLNPKNKPIAAAIKQPFTFRRGSKQALQPGESTSKTVGEGFPDFESKLSSLTEHTQMELKVNWEVPHAMQLYRKGIQFSTILTISGSETDAQAAICKDYVLEHFPKTGEILLAYVQAAWDSGESLYNGDGEASGSLNLSIPKGLDIPFDIMVNLAAVDYPFEYENGIVLKGSATLLAATATWETHAGTAFQWHLVTGGKNGISLSDYTDKYQIYQGEGKSASFELETVRKATRTFLGWCGSYLIQLANVDPAAVEVTQLSGAGASLVLKSIRFNAAVSKSPISLRANVAFEVQNDSIRYSREARFHEMITRSLTSPTLLYEPDEQRGWLVPQLSVLECMAVSNLQEIKAILLQHLRNNGLRDLLNDTENWERNTFLLKELLCDLSQVLEWAEEHSRRQRRLSGLFKSTIYGLEFYKLALMDKDHRIKGHQITYTHGGWVELLNQGVVKGKYSSRALDAMHISIGYAL